ncbi:MAG: transcriptional regulator [Desulfovibrio sp.]|nr:transcriptional regulator [Desulfovibrio sp.]
MWKLIIILLACYVLYKLFANDFLKRKKASEQEARAEQDRKIAAGEMVKDPECGVWVSVDDSISVRDGGKTWYFCSYECRDSFLKKLETGGRNLSRE